MEQRSRGQEIWSIGAGDLEYRSRGSRVQEQEIWSIGAGDLEHRSRRSGV